MSSPADDLVVQLLAANHVLITTHVRPDGDAIGTSFAMARALNQLGKKAVVQLLSPATPKYAWLIKNSGVELRPPEPFDLNGVDTMLVCDTGTWSQLPGVREPFEAFEGVTLVLDHHQTQEAWGDLRLVDPHAGAAAELAADVIRQMGVTMDHAIAECLFVGIVSDTGWFQYSNCRPPTLRLAADLMETGIDTDSIYQRLMLSERDCKIRLHSRGTQSLKLLANNTVAMMTLGPADFADTCADAPDTEDLVNVPLRIGSVRVSALLSQSTPDSEVRVSLRSKGQLDVAKFAEPFGGGGHSRAAGLRMDAPLDAAAARLQAALIATQADEQ